MDITRENNFHQKKGICVFAAKVVEGTEDGQIAAASDNHLIGYLPPDAVVTNAYVHTITASDAATSAVATLGTASGGTQILSAANLKTLGKVGTFTGQSLTTTGKPIYLGLTITGAATTVGRYLVVIEYLEYTKNTGEYTKIS